MDKAKLIEAGINYDQGVSRICGNPALFEKFLAKFLNDPNYNTLKAAVEDGDAEQTFRAAHSLKGLAGNLAMDRLFNAVNPLVEEVRSGAFGRAVELFAEVEKAYNQAVEAINS